MAYLYSKGNRLFGDIEFEDDTNTQIDFEDDYIALVAGGATVLAASGSMVGIGTATPDYTLDVAGDIGIDEKLIHNGDADTYIGFTGQNTINLVANGYSFLKYDGAIKINNANRDRDTQIMADDGTVALLVDAGTNTVTFNEEYTFPAADGSNKQVLTTDGSGTVTWEDSDGSSATASVVTSSSDIDLDSSYNGGTVIITVIGGERTYKLPDPAANFKVKFLAGTNLDAHNIVFKTKEAASKIFGLIYRISYTGDSETGWDIDPKSYNGAGSTEFAGGASEVHMNTITIDNALQGSDVDFYSDGVYWYVRGTIVATALATPLDATITFSSASY